MAAVLGMALLLVVLAARLPIGFSLTLVGFLGYGIVGGWGAALGMLGIEPYSQVTEYLLSAVPMFLLMGHFAHHTGISEEIYRTAYRWLGFLPRGLALATVAGCAGFAAASGSSVATAAVMGTVSLPQMARYNYHPRLATGCVAADGTLGILIPPSITLVLFGIITDTPIGELLIAGLIPGIMLACIFMLTIYVMAHRNPALGPRAEPFSCGERFGALWGVWGILVLFVLVMGGIYGGIFTPTEAAAVGAVGAFTLAALKRKFTFGVLRTSIMDTGRTTAMIFITIVGAVIFSYFLAITQVPTRLSEFLAGLPVSKYVIISGVIALYIPLGMFIEVIGVMLLTLPVLFPVAVNMGFDLVWFGVVVVIMMELGLITPPVGMNVSVISGIAKDVPLYEILRGILPFFLGMLLLVAILIVFPQIALFLPNTMR
ncbi:MAG: TRAP transporter large permease [Dehalococcoidia bacterium]|jgi:tripartite ATP-independent transporter DctM subunit|nr:TRAP transporter large permease [Dehalococcoidia bacterium]MDP6782167.1 TRAP transporter large permease [Dehalococcoidia bacterium]